MLNCECGACFEVWEAEPGQEVPCPECGQEVPVPAGEVRPRTSLLAVFSAALALMGACTVVGSLAAAFLGLFALAKLQEQRGRLAGAPFALFGIVAGLVFTSLTLFALARGGFGLIDRANGLLRRSQLDAGAAEADDLAGKGCALPRPAPTWGRVRGDRSDDPAVFDLQKDLDLLLLDPRRHAFLDVRIDHAAAGSPLPDAVGEVIDAFRPARPNVPLPGAEDDRPLLARKAEPLVLSRRALSLPGVAETEELRLEQQRGPVSWRFLIRVCRAKPGGPIYVVRAYAPAQRFAEDEEELTQALDGFRITAGR